MNAAVINLAGQVVWDRRGRSYRIGVGRNGAVIFKPRIRGLRDLVVWTSGKSNYLISKVLNWVFNATSYTPPTTLYFSLCTSAPSASSTGGSQSEASYTSYARVALAANNTNFGTSSSGGSLSNSVAITFPTNTGSSQTMLGFCINDASSSGNVLYFGSLTSTAIANGITPQVNIGSFTASEA